MMKLKLQYFGHLMQSLLIEKVPDAGKDWGQMEKGASEDEMIRCHRWFNAHEFEQLWGSEEQGSLASYSPWACKELDMTTTEQQQQHAFITFHFKPNNCHISKLP